MPTLTHVYHVAMHETQVSHLFSPFLGFIPVWPFVLFYGFDFSRKERLTRIMQTSFRVVYQIHIHVLVKRLLIKVKRTCNIMKKDKTPNLGSWR